MSARPSGSTATVEPSTPAVDSPDELGRQPPPWDRELNRRKASLVVPPTVAPLDMRNGVQPVASSVAKPTAGSQAPVPVRIPQAFPLEAQGAPRISMFSQRRKPKPTPQDLGGPFVPAPLRLRPRAAADPAGIEDEDAFDTTSYPLIRRTKTAATVDRSEAASAGHARSRSSGASFVSRFLGPSAAPGTPLAAPPQTPAEPTRVSTRVYREGKCWCRCHDGAFVVHTSVQTEHTLNHTAAQTDDVPVRPSYMDSGVQTELAGEPGTARRIRRSLRPSLAHWGPWSDAASSGQESDVSDLSEDRRRSVDSDNVAMGQMTEYFRTPGYSLGDALQ